MDNRIDLSDPEFLKDRRKSYRTLRTTAPVAFTVLKGEETVVLSRHRDVEALLRDRRTVIQPTAGAIPSYLGSGPASRFYRWSLPMVDPPEHNRLRRVVSPSFTPQAIARLEQWVAVIIERRIEEVQDGSVIDVVEQLGDTIPVDVACQLFHIPPADAARLVSRVNDIIPVLSEDEMNAEQLARADNAALGYFEYFSKHLDDHRGFPEQDIVGALSRAREAGLMHPEEAAAVLTDIFLGSYHTTMVSFTNAIHALALYPQQRAALIADPSLAARAWEEVLRFAPPVHFRHRYISEPLVIDGYRLESKVKVMMGLAAANWDETAFDNPDVFDILRSPNRHVAFGGGGHFCLGSQLSRLEGKIFLPRFLARFPHFELAAEPPVCSSAPTFPFIEHLYIRPVRNQ